jgi:hypothetical protein
MMSSQIRIACIALALCAQWTHAAAQTVYRCGESYSNQPCPGGAVIATGDSRTPAQRAESNATTKREAAAAGRMEQERLKQEAKPAQAVIPVPMREEEVAVADRTAPKAKTKKPELFTAVAPKKPGAKPDRKSRKKKQAEKAAA